MKTSLIQLLLSGVFVTCGLLPSLAQTRSQPIDTQVAALVEALRKAAPQTGKVNDGLYSDWQVKPETIKGWSRYCLKREITAAQFEAAPKLAHEVVSCITRRELNQQFAATNNSEIASVRGVACWWMTGSYQGCNTGFTATYVQKVVGFYQQERAKPAPNR